MVQQVYPHVLHAYCCLELTGKYLRSLPGSKVLHRCKVHQYHDQKRQPKYYQGKVSKYFQETCQCVISCLSINLQK